MENNECGHSPNELMIFPVLLAGGSGTRLWPVSRTQAPKQLVEFSGETSLLQETIQRLSPALCIDNVRIVCGEGYRNESSDHLAAIGVTPENKIIGEPIGRNTAPAILLAIMKILDQQAIEDALFFIFPADHVIRDVTRFHQDITRAIDLAQKGYLVTFGIQPDYPETGYGYIEGRASVSKDGLSIERFVEKPDVATAESYIKAGNFFWNSGMFAFRGSVILGEFRKYQPVMFKQMTVIVQQGDPIPVDSYERLDSISFDVAIMEKTTRGVVLPSDFGWSDIGSWKSLHASLPKDKVGNAITGDVVVHNTRNSLLIAKSRLIAVNDLSDVAVVETSDAVFVSGLETSRNVKDIVSLLEQQNRREHQVHLLEKHDWGTIQFFEKTDEIIVARLTLKPQATYRFNLASRGRWHICLIAGNCQIASGQIQHQMQAGESRSVDIQDGLFLQNTNKTDLMGIITYQQEI